VVKFVRTWITEKYENLNRSKEYFELPFIRFVYICMISDNQ